MIKISFIIFWFAEDTFEEWRIAPQGRKCRQMANDISSEKRRCNYPKWSMEGIIASLWSPNVQTYRNEKSTTSALQDDPWMEKWKRGLKNRASAVNVWIGWRDKAGSMDVAEIHDTIIIVVGHSTFWERDEWQTVGKYPFQQHRSSKKPQPFAVPASNSREDARTYSYQPGCSAEELKPICGTTDHRQAALNAHSRAHLWSLPQFGLHHSELY